MMNTSIKKLNLLATMIKGKSFMDAFTSLMFLKKDHTAHVLWALQQGAKIARDMQNADPNNLVVGKL